MPLYPRATVIKQRERVTASIRIREAVQRQKWTSHLENLIDLPDLLRDLCDALVPLVYEGFVVLDLSVHLPKFKPLLLLHKQPDMFPVCCAVQFFCKTSTKQPIFGSWSLVYA